jgi:hypothetical protein
MSGKEEGEKKEWRDEYGPCILYTYMKTEQWSHQIL